jgi:peptidylprolyl isomerase
MPTRRQATSTLTAAATGAALALVLAACGSSKASGVTPAPSAGLTAAQSTAAATTATTPTTPTPPPALAKKPVVTVPKTAPKSLVVKDLVKGTGQAAVTGDNITVNYVGVLQSNGKEFDSSWKTGSPVTLPLKQGGVIQGWVDGITGMHVGGRRELIIPANLAYAKVSRPGIPANSSLVFVVDLLSIG